MSDGYGYTPATPTSGTPTSVKTDKTYVVPKDQQVIAFLDVQVDGDIRFDGDWVFV